VKRKKKKNEERLKKVLVTRRRKERKREMKNVAEKCLVGYGVFYFVMFQFYFFIFYFYFFTLNKTVCFILQPLRKFVLEFTLLAFI